jgi:hypothetical protein
LGYGTDDLEFKYPDYDYSNPLHNKLVKAAAFFEITLGNFQNNIKKHNEVSLFISNYQAKYGKDSFSAIEKGLLFECRDKGFSYELFTILCAINSIVGKKKKFARITYDRIRYAMHGYRSKSIYQITQAVQKTKIKSQIQFLTDRQLKKRVDLLNAKKFFSKFTYQHRQIFISTRLNDEQLREAVKSSKIFWAKKKIQLVDQAYSLDIKKELENISLESRTIREHERLINGKNKSEFISVN